MYYYKQMVFIVKRVLLFIFINIGCGIIVPILMSVINNAIADNGVQNTIGSDGVQSFAAWLVTLALMCRVMWEDGRKNTAYEIFDAFFTMLCFAVMFFVYFAPVVFIENAGEISFVLLSHYYTTCDWIRTGKIGYTTAAASAALLEIAPIAVVYVTSHFLYLKKHPDL